MIVNNYAFVDSQNLNLGVANDGRKLDFQKLFIYLRDKYKTQKVFLFLGYVENNKKLYQALEKFGYTLIFKPVLSLEDGKIKGNVDAELVLHTMIEFNNFDKAIIISGDGDFYCLIEYLKQENKLFKIGVPNKKRYSFLLRKFRETFFYFNDLRYKLEYKKNNC